METFKIDQHLRFRCLSGLQCVQFRKWLDGRATGFRWALYAKCFRRREPNACGFSRPSAGAHDVRTQQRDDVRSQNSSKYCDPPRRPSNPRHGTVQDSRVDITSKPICAHGPPAAPLRRLAERGTGRGCGDMRSEERSNLRGRIAISARRPRCPANPVTRSDQTKAPEATLQYWKRITSDMSNAVDTQHHVHSWVANEHYDSSIEPLEMPR